MTKLFTAAFVLGAIVSLVPHPSYSGVSSICKRETSAALQRVGVKPSRLFWVDSNGEDNSKWYIFWFETKVCGSSGYVVVTTNENCYVHDVFTRYRCQMPGLRRWM